VATIVQDAIDTAIANPDKTWGEYAKERPEAAYETLIATLVQSGIVGGVSAISRYGQDVSKSQDALNTQEELNEQVAAANESKLRVRSPEEYKKFLNDVVGAEDEVYMSAEDVDTFFQSNPEVLDILPAEMVEAIDESVATGNDLFIQKSDYLTYLTEYHDQLSDVVRNDMDGMNAKEANEWVEQGNEQFEMEAERILAEMESETEFRDSADKVAQTIKEQIVQTGRFTEDTAEKYSQLHKAFAVTMADKLGVTPEQVYEKFGLQVKGAPVVGEAYDQEGQLKTETPEFKQWFGDSKVVDESGEPLIVYHGTTKEFDSFDLTKKGINTIFGAQVEADRSAVFLSENKDFSKAFTPNANVLKLYVSANNTLDLDSAKGKEIIIDFYKHLFDIDMREQALAVKSGHLESWQLFDGDIGQEFVKYLTKNNIADSVSFDEDTASPENGERHI